MPRPPLRGDTQRKRQNRKERWVDAAPHPGPHLSQSGVW